MPDSVAYLTCPDCMMPNHVANDSIKYMCFSCFAEVVFETCQDCSYKQSVPKRWQTAFTCGRCGERCELPRGQRWYSSSTKAFGVEGYGYVYPKL